MRKLTVLRKKKFAACMAKSMVYIEDPSSEELLINDVPVRKLGTLKNGGELSAVIGENPLKVFVIVDKMSKDYCNDCYQLPAGGEDVTLTGMHRFSPSNGNAFRFDNNDSKESIEMRKKANKKGRLTTVFAMIIGFIIGFLLVWFGIL